MNNLSKWDKWRALILWWERWILSANKIASQSAARTWVWLVSPIVLDEYIENLENLINPYNMKIFSIKNFKKEGLEKVLSLLSESNSLWYWIWLSLKNNDLKKFSEELFINSEKTIIFDWPITQYLNCNIKNKNNINHIILLNKKEQLNFFWKDYSNDIYVSRMAQKLSSYIVLKWEYTPIFLPDWQKIIRYSWWCKELVVAWSWDLLLWYISWFVAQSFDLLKSIEISIDLRERSSKYYKEKTNDIIALPSDIVENTRFVINNLIKKYE